MEVHNLLAGIPERMTGEVFEEILRAESFRIERIVSRGQVSPPGFWYDQETDEWVLLAAGSATLRFADGREGRSQAGRSPPHPPASAAPRGKDGPGAGDGLAGRPFRRRKERLLKTAKGLREASGQKAAEV